MNVLKTAAIVLALGAVNMWAGADEGNPGRGHGPLLH